MSTWGSHPFGAPPRRQPQPGDTVLYYAPDGTPPALAVIQAVHPDGTLKLGVFTAVDNCATWAWPPAL